jgi:hypothetical protein
MNEQANLGKRSSLHRIRPRRSLLARASAFPLILSYLGLGRIWSHHFWSNWDFVALGSGT